MRCAAEAGTRFDLYRLGRDERREVFQMLERLPKSERVAFLKWCCRAAVLPGGQRAQVEKTSGEARDVFGDWMLLAASHNLSVRASYEELTRRCRRCDIRG